MSEGLADLGPRMSALPPKQQAFVLALFDEHCPIKRKAQLVFAARAAGYGGPKSNDKSLEYMGRRVEASDSVRAAIEEETRRQNRSIGPAAVTALRKVIADPKHRDHVRAIGMVLDRLDPPKAELNVKIESVPPSPETIEVTLRKIDELARKAGVALPPPAPTIETDFEVVAEERAPV